MNQFMSKKKMTIFGDGTQTQPFAYIQFGGSSEFMPRQLITALILLGVFVFTLFAYSIGSYILLLLGIVVPALLCLGRGLILFLLPWSPCRSVP